MENISTQITLLDANNAAIASQTAILPLNILPPGASLPLTVFFPPEIPSEVKPQVQVLTAIRLLPGGSLPFEFTVSSLGGRIERVEFAVEARP
jgi:hypothetical protein